MIATVLNFLGLGKISPVIAMVGIVAVLGLIGVGLTYFNYTQNKMDELNKNNAKLFIITQTQDKTISILEKSMGTYQAETERLNKRFNEIKRTVANLEVKFSKHDLFAIGTKKPKLLEKIINKATKETLKEFEEITQINNFNK